MNSFNYIKTKDSDLLVSQSLDDSMTTFQALPAGLYKPHDVGGMMQFKPAYEPVVQGDNLVAFSDGVVADVVAKADEFFGEHTVNIYAELKLTHKMGMILHGPPGTGKTCTATLIMQKLAEKHNAVCLIGTNVGLGKLKAFIKAIRRHQDNPIVLFIDEIDDAIDNEEYAYLPFLDGGDSVSKMIVLGCTNNLGDIPARIKNRKSRIKHLFEVKSFPLRVYKEYISDRLPSIGEDELAKFGYLAVDNGLTLDNLKHAVIDYKIENISIEESIERVIQSPEEV